MAENNRDDSRDENRPVRRVYQSPAVVDTAEFETLAQGCGKFQTGGGPLCFSNPTAS